MINNTPPPEAKTQTIRGIRYVFIPKPFWNKAKKYGDNKRVYIGKYDREGNYIPYPESHRQRNKQPEINSSVNVITPARNYYYGATYLLDEITRKIGIGEDLQVCFPEDHSKLLSLAYYLVLESDSPMYRYDAWARRHLLPFQESITSQLSSRLLSNISEAGKLEFFKRQCKRRLETEYLAYDTTSISSTSEFINSAKYGVNKDKDNLPQVNLALLFGEKSLLPVYYRIIPGNISDVSTIDKLTKDIKFLEIKNLKLILDRAFYSEKNMDILFKGDYDFILSMKQNINFIKECLEEASKEIKLYINRDDKHNIHCCNYQYIWNYNVIPEKGNFLKKEKKDLYVHVYFDREKETTEFYNFNKQLDNIIYKINNKEQINDKDSKYMSKFLSLSINKAGEKVIAYNEECISDYTKYFGYFVLLSNKNNVSSNVLDYYRQRDVVEKAFNKHRFSGR
jgi:transposase